MSIQHDRVCTLGGSAVIFTLRCNIPIGNLSFGTLESHKRNSGLGLLFSSVWMIFSSFGSQLVISWQLARNTHPPCFACHNKNLLASICDGRSISPPQPFNVYSALQEWCDPPITREFARTFVSLYPHFLFPPYYTGVDALLKHKTKLLVVFLPVQITTASHQVKNSFRSCCVRLSLS